MIAELVARAHQLTLIKKGQWTELEISESPFFVRLHYGTIHSNGMEERAIATRCYEPDGRWTSYVHA